MPTHLRPIYQPDETGLYRLYAGDLIVNTQGGTHSIPGDIVLTLTPKTGLKAYIAGDDLWLAEALFGGQDIEVSLPGDAPLTPSGSSAIQEVEGFTQWTELDPTLQKLTSGNISTCARFIFHTNGRLTDYPFPRIFTDSGEQGQIEFGLPGWKLRMAAVDHATQDGSQLTAVIEAVADSGRTSESGIAQLRRKLFITLSFICGRETALGPIAGLNEAGHVTWIYWDAPRSRSTTSQRWCSRGNIAEAIPMIANGISEISDTPLEVVADRAINHLLSAGGDEVLDVRIPTACSGLELLGWAVLQYRGWLTPEIVDKLPAAARLRLLLTWAGIPVELPADFLALSAMKGRIGQPSFAGPEMVFKVRNDLVHPPKKINSLEWPNTQEMFECWRLTAWYLELVILRLLNYRGEYASRLRLRGWEGDTEPLPWISS